MKKTTIALSLALLMSGSLHASDQSTEKQEALQQLDKEIEIVEAQNGGLEISYESGSYDKNSNMVTLDDVVLFVPKGSVALVTEKDHDERLMVFVDEVSYTYGPEIKSTKDIPDLSKINFSGVSIDLSKFLSKDASNDSQAFVGLFAGNDNIINMDLYVKQTLNKEDGEVNIKTNATIGDLGKGQVTFSVSGLLQNDVDVASDLNGAFSALQLVAVNDVKFHAHSSDFNSLATEYAAKYGSTLTYVKQDLQSRASKLIRTEDKNRIEKIYENVVTTFYIALNEDKQVHLDITVGKPINLMTAMMVMGASDVNGVLESLDVSMKFNAK